MENNDFTDSAITNWHVVCHEPVRYISPEIEQIARMFASADQQRKIDMDTLNTALQRYLPLNSAEGKRIPQLAPLIYDVTRNLAALAPFFPITKKLNETERQQFEQQIDGLIKSLNFSLLLWDSNQTEVTRKAPPSLMVIVAAHIVEAFFYRPDLLERFFSKPRSFDIYVNSAAYQQAGGVAGGCYDPQSESIKLVASRLYEGFYGPVPGVAPFLHEFGHMLDVFHPDSGQLGRARGLLPGMFASDGPVFTPSAREQFIAGKRLELERYEQARRTKPADPNQIPVGHPYVFQNDGEFIAGYFEMFFRNPNRFAELNPILYEGFTLLFNQDPRDYWETDFDFYINGNRRVYLEHREGIHRPGLRMFS